MSKYEEIKEQKMKHLDGIAHKEDTFKPKIYSTTQKASKYYERKLKKEQIA